jgi:hypothetical protein
MIGAFNDSAPPHITSHYITSHYITSHYITLHQTFITPHYITSHYITTHHIPVTGDVLSPTELRILLILRILSTLDGTLYAWEYLVLYTRNMTTLTKAVGCIGGNSRSKLFPIT